MKKFLLTMLSCLLLLTLAAPAQANEWGLQGGAYEIVSRTDRYDGYQAVADDGNCDWSWAGGCTVNHAVLQNRYHTVLIVSSQREGEDWKADVISTTAVYQPGQTTETLEIFQDEIGTLTLKYGPEQYTFSYDADSCDYWLVEAYYGSSDGWYSNSYRTAANGLEFWSSGPENTFLPIGDALWCNDGVTLSEFNLTQMPRSLAEINRANRTGDALTAYGPAWQVYQTLQGTAKGDTLAVYSAPDESSWRAAEGKASVSLGGEVDVIGTVDGWTLIKYEVSPRTCRIGYVNAELAEGAEIAFAEIPLVTQADTFLTDDPFVSQYAQLTLPAGTIVTGLAKAGEYYAYVETEKDGQLIRGFVPLKDLDTQYDLALDTGTELLSSEVRWDVIEALVGKWRTESNDSGMLILFAGGGYRNHWERLDEKFTPEGNYRVYDVEDSDGSTYLIRFFTEDNEHTTCTLHLNEDGTITMTDEAGTEMLFWRNEYSTFGNG